MPLSDRIRRAIEQTFGKKESTSPEAQEALYQFFTKRNLIRMAQPQYYPPRVITDHALLTNVQFGQHHGHHFRWISNTGPGDYLAEGASIAIGTIGRVFLMPLDVPCLCTIDRLGYWTGGTINGNIRLGLYVLGVAGYPDLPDGAALLAETASLAQPATLIGHIGTIPDTALSPGIHFIGLQIDNATGTALQMTFANTQWSHSVDGTVSIHSYYDRVGGYGAFTTPCPVTTPGGTFRLFKVFMRVKSIP